MKPYQERQRGEERERERKRRDRENREKERREREKYPNLPEYPCPRHNPSSAGKHVL